MFVQELAKIFGDNITDREFLRDSAMVLIDWYLDSNEITGPRRQFIRDKFENEWPKIIEQVFTQASETIH